MKNKLWSDWKNLHEALLREEHQLAALVQALAAKDISPDELNAGRGPYSVLEFARRRLSAGWSRSVLRLRRRCRTLRR